MGLKELEKLDYDDFRARMMAECGECTKEDCEKHKDMCWRYQTKSKLVDMAKETREETIKESIQFIYTYLNVGTLKYSTLDELVRDYRKYMEER